MFEPAQKCEHIAILCKKYTLKLFFQLECGCFSYVSRFLPK